MVRCLEPDCPLSTPNDVCTPHVKILFCPCLFTTFNGNVDHTSGIEKIILIILVFMNLSTESKDQKILLLHPS